ncbi:glycosyltransferase family 4 protein [Svornostia abyssi]|uniref:Glycosyltransferase family 4 protein n=1 Tax=Svornostia abyssi TaxID=2898438 RepID=A0ABY5PFV1_9ACTN|nr:glycosyltransferase family 4 protein [Parviterribacteraceae bacterium J379]
MLRTAIRTAPAGVRAAVWQVFYVLEAGLVWDRLHREGVTHIHAHFANSASAVALLAAELGRADGLRWSFTMHGPTEFDDVDGFAVAEKARSAAFVACIGDYCRSQVMKLTPPEVWDRLVVVRCGVDTERFAPDLDRPRPAAGPLRVLCVGRLVPDKGQELLLRALALLQDRGIEAELVLAGDGPSRERLEAACKTLRLNSSVRFLGSVGQDRMLDVYGDADVFCLPSFAEGIPVVLMEAMATGLPVVTSRIMGIPELVEDGVSGLLVPPGRVEAIADALEELHRDPARRHAMGEAGRARVEGEFRVDRSALELRRRFAGVAAPVADAVAVLPG